MFYQLGCPFPLHPSFKTVVTRKGNHFEFPPQREFREDQLVPIPEGSLEPLDRRGCDPQEMGQGLFESLFSLSLLSFRFC